MRFTGPVTIKKLNVYYPMSLSVSMDEIQEKRRVVYNLNAANLI